jgi:hypothetical protein
MVILRLSAFIVLCIGVEIMWNGIKALAPEITSEMRRHHAGESAMSDEVRQLLEGVLWWLAACFRSSIRWAMRRSSWR